MGANARIVIAAGGTAGHINPALALAEELRERGHNVSFVGQPTRLEASLVPAQGFDFIPIDVTGFDRSRPWTLVSALWRMVKAERTLARHFEQFGRPDVCVGFGAYVEMPLMRLCAREKIPALLHEQNSVPGLANKTCARTADILALAFPGARAAFEGACGKNTNIVVCGNPVRKSVLAATRDEGRKAFGLTNDKTLLLVFGGSLGARHINEGICARKEELLSRKELTIVHSTGKDEFEAVVSALNLSPDEQKQWQLVPYIENMGEALAAADCVLSRAGASSIAEIAARAVPSVLVPYPLATADHQTTNAHLLVDAGAAFLLPDDQIDTPSFDEALFSLIDDEKLREYMRDSARKLKQDQAQKSLADNVESLIPS